MMEKTRLSAAVLCIAMTATQAFPYIPGPPSQAAQPAWLAQLYANRTAQRAAVNYSGAVYDNYLLWSPSLHIVPQSHLYDRYLYDPVKGAVDPAKGWTVDRFLDDLDARYGGIDGVLLWNTYPNLGVDERSQFDLVGDVPGGLDALRDVVAQFNERGVRVGIPYNPWDLGTARRDAADETVLAQLAATIGADFVNGDTMGEMPLSFWNASVAAGRPLALQPEGGSGLDALAFNKIGWAYWMTVFETIPIVDPWKVIEHRHISQICNRWATDHMTDLLRAFFNGDGFVPWENVWGIWNGLSPRDAEATRRVGALLRFLTLFFRADATADSTSWTPHTPVSAAAYAAGVFASQWVLPAGGESPYAELATAYTIIANGTAAFSGPALPVPCAAPGVTYFDLYAGAATPLVPMPAPEGGCALPLVLEARAFGAVLALSGADAASPPAALGAFLAKMAAMTARPLASFDTAPTYLQQTMTFIAPAPLATVPAGAVRVAGQRGWPFAVTGTEIEGRAGRQNTTIGTDVQFPWEIIAEQDHAAHAIDVPDLFVDMTPVTNQQYAAFLAASGYAPTDDYNFLRDWAGARTPPAGWEQKPVTWVDLLDARAYCAAAGKRLPHDWEFQYVAQSGNVGQLYPWGNAWVAANVPPQQNGTVRPPPPDVGSYPGGDTPHGLKDMMGLVWQWTDEFMDDHTRSGLVRGGTYYTPMDTGAWHALWYFPAWLPPLPVPNGHSGTMSVNLNTHNKLLLMAPAYDRHGTVGFRCVADVQDAPSS